MAIEKITDDGLSGNRVAKAWMSLDMATPVILDSFNITSVVDDAIGQFGVNLTNAMADTNYAIIASAKDVSNNTVFHVGAEAGWYTRTTSYFGLSSGTTSSFFDNDNYSVVVFGDQ